jgi:TRAP-type C4-dicarboxylate transport system substrate-binding protein
MHKILRLGALATLLASAVASAQAADNEAYTLKIHHFLSPTSIQHTKMFKDWCDDIGRDSGGRLKCQIFPAMQLGGTQPQLYDQARDGVADIVWTLPGSTAGRFPKIEVFELPFIMSSPEATAAAAWDYYEKHARDEFGDVKVLAVHGHGPGVVYTSKRPVKTIEDMKGLKLRGPSRLVTKLIAALGATPVGMPIPAIPDAMSKGVIDGAVTTYEIAPTIKLDQLSRYVAQADPAEGGIYSAFFVMAMNKKRYESLPPDLQQVIDKHSGRDLSVTFAHIMAENDKPSKEKVIAGGNVITILDRHELQKWRKASEIVAEEWVAEMNKRGVDGQALLADARALIAKYTQQMPPVPPRQ